MELEVSVASFPPALSLSPPPSVTPGHETVTAATPEQPGKWCYCSSDNSRGGCFDRGEKRERGKGWKEEEAFLLYYSLSADRCNKANLSSRSTYRESRFFSFRLFFHRCDNCVANGGRGRGRYFFVPVATSWLTSPTLLLYFSGWKRKRGRKKPWVMMCEMPERKKSLKKGDEKVRKKGFFYFPSCVICRTSPWKMRPKPPACVFDRAGEFWRSVWQMKAGRMGGGGRFSFCLPLLPLLKTRPPKKGSREGERRSSKKKLKANRRSKKKSLKIFPIDVGIIWGKALWLKKNKNTVCLPIVPRRKLRSYLPVLHSTGLPLSPPLLSSSGQQSLIKAFVGDSFTRRVQKKTGREEEEPRKRRQWEVKETRIGWMDRMRENK